MTNVLAQEVKVILSLPDGVKISVPPYLSCITTYVLLEQEDWFEDEIRFLRRVLKPGMIAVDIGANFGVFSLSLAAVLGPQGQVVAIEPASRTMEYLRYSAELNGFSQITPIMAAVSDQDGEGFLRFGNSEESHALATNIDQDQDGETVGLITLDGLMACCDFPQVDFLKIDGEGHEIAIIAGGQEFLNRYDPIILLEILGADGEIHVDVVDVLRAKGYQIFRLIVGLDVLVPVDNQALIDRKSINAFAMKPSAAARWAAAGVLVAVLTAPPAWDDRAVRDHLLRDYWAAQPWAVGYLATWEGWLDQLSPDDPDYLYADAMALWVVAQSKDQSATQKAESFLVAVEILRHLCQFRLDANWLMALTKMEWMAGNRRATFWAVSHLETAWLAQKDDFFQRPFLPLIDWPDPSILHADWMVMGIDIALDQTAAWSGFFR